MKNNMMKINRMKGLWSIIGVITGCSLLVVGYAALADGDLTTELRIEGTSQTVFSGDIEVGDCEVTDTDGGVHSFSGMAVCALTNALNEISVEAIYKDFGFGLFLDGIGDDTTPADWSYSWSFWINGEPASVGVDGYAVATGDELLLAFSVYPTVPLVVNLPDIITAGDPFNIEVSQIIGEYDANFIWHGSITPAEGANLWVDDTLHNVDATGFVEVLIDEAGAIEAWAESVGKVRSLRHVAPVLAASLPPPSPSPSPSVSPTISPSPSVIPSPLISPSPSPSPTIIVEEVSREEREQAALKALQYLRDNQNTNGTIGGAVVSGWSAMAFGASSERASNVKVGNATLWDSLSLASLDRATDVERQIMAVRAAGGDPRTWQGHNLIADLRTFYRQGQFGEETLINDDIFGVLALLAADEPVTAVEVRQGITNIISWQEANGSWGNVDLSAAAIQALREYKARGGDIDVKQAVKQARDYLKDRQDDDGGFAGNSASTAWGIQAILALGENPNNWSNELGRTPWHAMLKYQKDNGGISWKLTDTESTFMTAYAVPALLGVPWPIQVLDIDNNLTETEQTGLTSSPLNSVNLAPPGVVPAVAGASTTKALSNEEETPDKTYSNGVVTKKESLTNNNEIAEESASINKIDPRKNDFRFAFTLFGLVNMGVGVTVARLVMRI